MRRAILCVVMAILVGACANGSKSGRDPDDMFANAYDPAFFTEINTPSQFYTAMLLYPDTGPADAAMVCVADKMGALFPARFQDSVKAFVAAKSAETWNQLVAVERSTRQNVSSYALTKNAKDCVAANPS